MKKLLTLLLLATFFVSCSSDDDNNDNPKENITLTVDQIIGSYVLTSFIDDNGNSDPINLTKGNTIELKDDLTGKRFSLKDQKFNTFTWSINKDNVIFNIDILGDAKCTLKNNELTIKAKSEFSGNMGTYIYKKTI